jgi:hypothetical protein
MAEELNIKGADGVSKPTSCVFVNSSKDATGKMFIPTNSQGEVQAFVDTLSDKPVNGVSVRNCASEFAANTVDGTPNAAKKEKAVGYTWVGTTDCSQIAAKIACNETKIISAQRYCQFENGTLGGCEACDGVPDPEEKKDSKFYDFIRPPDSVGLGQPVDEVWKQAAVK